MGEPASRADWPRATPRCPLRPASQSEPGRGLCRARRLPPAPQATTCPPEQLGRRLSGAHAGRWGHRAQMLGALAASGLPQEPARPAEQGREPVAGLGKGDCPGVTRSSWAVTRARGEPRFHRRRGLSSVFVCSILFSVAEGGWPGQLWTSGPSGRPPGPQATARALEVCPAE